MALLIPSRNLHFFCSMVASIDRTAAALREEARYIGGRSHAPRGYEGYQRRQVCECPSSFQEDAAAVTE